MPGPGCPNVSRTRSAPSRSGKDARARAIVVVAGLVAGLLAPGASALSLDEAVQQALSRNERPAILKERRDAARSRIDVARARLKPELSLSADYTRRAHEQVRTTGGVSTVIRDRDDLIATTRLGMPLFDPSAEPLVRRARLLAEGAELDLDDERRLLVRDVTQAYLLALSAEQVLQAAERRMQYAEQALGDARARAEAGLASINDVTKVQLELATASREATSARAAREEAYLVLAYLIASDVQGPLDPPVTLVSAAEAPPPPADELAARAVARRLDVQSRRKLADAWDAYAEEPPRRWIPSLDLNGTHEIFLDEEDSEGHGDDWDLSLGFTWDVFDAGLRAAEKRERLAQAGEAELQASVLERSVANEVRRAHVAMTSTQASVREAEQAVDASRRNAEETFELYRQGLRTALEVADAGNRAFDADVSLTRERLALTLAWVDLLVAVGSDPLSPEPLP